MIALRTTRLYSLVLAISAFLFASTAFCQNARSWPTYRHDNRRSGVTDERLRFPLTQRWVWKSPQLPQMAWTGPAKWDAYSSNAGLQSMRNFDPCFFVTADKQSVFFGSSADDSAHALDASTGVEQWRYVTGAAVRFPPTISNENVLFGSDDGCVYCCRKDTGELVWKQTAAPNRKHITSNRKLISQWPVRTGVLVDNDRATFAASLVPWETSVLWTVQARTGKTNVERCYRREILDVTLQGALLASRDRFYVPQGRAAPLAFERNNGKSIGTIGEAGGVFCILSEDDKLFAGPQDQRETDEQIRVSDPKTKRAIASFSGTNRILVSGPMAWISTEGKLKCFNQSAYVKAQDLLDRANGDMKSGREPVQKMLTVIKIAEKRLQDAWKWTMDCPTPMEMIKTHDSVILGLHNQIRALAANDGQERWRVDLDGDVHGLAVANGQLYVSTSSGNILAFASTVSDKQ